MREDNVPFFEKTSKSINALIKKFLSLHECAKKIKAERQKAQKKIECLKKRLNRAELQLSHRSLVHDIESASKFFRVGRER